MESSEVDENDVHLQNVSMECQEKPKIKGEHLSM